MLRLHPTRSSTTAGFTLPEALVVIVIATVLAAIAAPNLLGLLNNRRSSTVRDDIIQAIRQTQSEATSRRTSQILEIDTTANPLPTLDIPGSGLKPVANGNVPGETLTVTVRDGDGNANPVQQIEFDENGAIEPDTVALPLTVEVTFNGRGRRCAIVQSLLGTIRAESGDACN
ncbi:MAG: prepilin-type N-terminal cleavage/methylation domain-containing protein [Cyanobacteria bacterium J06638_22]